MCAHMCQREEGCGHIVDCVYDSVFGLRVCLRLGCSGEHLGVVWEGLWTPPYQVPPALGLTMPSCLGESGA